MVEEPYIMNHNGNDKLLGQLMAAIAELSKAVEQLERRVNGSYAAAERTSTYTLKIVQFLKRVPCLQGVDIEDELDTNPECPRGFEVVHGERMQDIEEGERDSVVTRAMTLRVGPIQLRGPAIMVLLSVVMLVIGGFIPKIVHWFIH